MADVKSPAFKRGFFEIGVFILAKSHLERQMLVAQVSLLNIFVELLEQKRHGYQNGGHTEYAEYSVKRIKFP